MPDMNEINFTNVVRDLQKWESCGKKLQELAAEVKERIGDAQFTSMNPGSFIFIPTLLRRLIARKTKSCMNTFCICRRTAKLSGE